MRHELKCLPVYFQAVADRTKNFELRKDDRDFHIGDTIVLMEYDPIKNCYMGRSIKRKVKEILINFNGLKEGYCILGF